MAHTQRQHAELLLARDRPEDASEAETNLAEANQIYRELGMHHLYETTAAPPHPPVASNVFRRDGDMWTVRYDGREARVQHVKGLMVLTRLLAQPGRELHVADLAADGDEKATALLRSAGTGEVIDARARREYKRRLDQLEAEIDDARACADLHRAERAELERDALVAELTRAFGLAGRARQDHDPSERARWTITKQVRTAIARIGHVHPELARHLTTTVRTGRYCTYTPEHPVDWDT